jgi:3-hydroxyisobutyrate dehydrogenase
MAEDAHEADGREDDGMKIGIAGLGRMAENIGARLMDQGHTLVIWNRTPAKTKALAERGATVVGSAADVASQAEVIITMLTDGAAIDAVYRGPNGLLSGDVAGKLFIDMSTVRSDVEVALAKDVRGKGAALVDCPVGGSVNPARDGKLFGFLGGEPADAERAKPIVDQLCRRVEYCGPVGSGALMKLAINLPLIVAWQAFGEAFALCRDLGFTPERLVDIFADTNGANNAFRGRASKIADIIAGRDAGPVTFSLANAQKDARTMAEEGKARGVELPLIEGSIACFGEAIDAGWADADGSSQPVYWAKRGAK